MSDSQPSFLQKPVAAPVPRRRRWPGPVIVVALLAALSAQVVLADRARLASDPTWRPRLEALCASLGCSLPPWRQPAAFRVLAREIQPHPDADGVLVVTATFRNDAAFAQAWPRLEVRLTDLEGEVIGLRRFAPRDYLGGEPTSSRIEPGQAIQASLEIVDPGKRALAFALDFH